MIHPATIATQASKTKKEAAEELISFWKENDIYVRPSGYLNIFLGLGFFSVIFFLDTPYLIYFQSLILVVLILKIRRFWLEKKADKSDTQHDDPVEQVSLQKEKMIAQKARSMKVVYWGFPIIMILKISSFYLYSPNESWGEIALFAGIFFVAGIAAIIFNRSAFVQPIADADKVLSMED